MTNSKHIVVSQGSIFLGEINDHTNSKRQRNKHMVYFCESWENTPRSKRVFFIRNQPVVVGQMEIKAPKESELLSLFMMNWWQLLRAKGKELYDQILLDQARSFLSFQILVVDL